MIHPAGVSMMIPRVLGEFSVMPKKWRVISSFTFTDSAFSISWKVMANFFFSVCW